METMNQLDFLGNTFELKPTGLQIHGQPSFEVCASAFETLKRINGCVMWWIGDLLLYTESQYGEKYTQVLDETDYSYSTISHALYVSKSIEFFRRRQNLTWSHHAEVAALEPSEQDRLLMEAEEKGLSKRELRKLTREAQALPTPELQEGKYRTIVVDPPWQMEKILREVRPNQRQFDYRQMSIEEIIDFPIPSITDTSGCHLYLWTTHKYLPDAINIMAAWGFNYQCVLTWIKNVGFTPFSWMYSTELCLFGRCGSLDVEKKGIRLDFQGKVREHSRKPDEFYDIVRLVSPAPRIDVFSREKRTGFDQYGNETEKFSERQEAGIAAG